MVTRHAAGTQHQVFGLDVLRALAVLLVVASHCGTIFATWYHAGVPFLVGYGAYIGIELFFVLSGFLIGGLLIRQAQRPDIAQRRFAIWRIFMARRWLRTLPLYYVCLVVLAVFWAPVAWISGGQLLLAVVAFGTLLQNLAWPMVVGNFFDVTWSLAVEEWFYLGFSALLFLLLARNRPAPALVVVTLAFLLLPAPIRWWMLRAPGASDHVVLCWLDQIALGVVVAAVAAWRPGWLRGAVWLLAPSALLMVFELAGGLGRFGLSSHWFRTLDPDVMGVALALCLPAAARWREATGAIAAITRAISRWSYPIYLIHLTVISYISFERRFVPLAPMPSILISLGTIVALSWALSRFIERPVMARRPSDRPWQAATPSLGDYAPGPSSP